MVSLVDARETIYQRFATQWGATTAYVFDNEKFEPPVATSWVRVAVRHRNSTLEAIGGPGLGGLNTFQRTGVVSIQVFVPLDSGLRGADTLAQQARAIFEGTTLASNSIRFTNSDVFEAGPSNGWFLVTVLVQFQYDERK